MGPGNVTRRELLKFAGTASIAEFISLVLHGCGGIPSNASSTPSSCAKLADIEHVAIIIQEIRSFDHYFGSYRGVRGFSDQSSAFQQPNPANINNPPVGKLLPFHLDASTINAACTHDITHDWLPQHQSWNNGAMDGFVTSRLAINPDDAILTMGYYSRADLPFYFALADSFTICAHYF
jgi:phospholipase C